VAFRQRKRAFVLSDEPIFAKGIVMQASRSPVRVLRSGCCARVAHAAAALLSRASWLISWRSFLQSDRSILLECRIPATNRETLARFSPQTAKPESLRRSTPETGVR
jgi:hypothetical protein